MVVAHNIGITIYDAKITSIDGRLKGYSKPPLLGIEPPTLSFKRSLMTAPLMAQWLINLEIPVLV